MEGGGVEKAGPSGSGPSGAVPVRAVLGNMRSGDGKLNLLCLPDLAKHRICSFLDLYALQNLRLTCKNLKACVEQPSVLALMPVKITSSKQLQRILHCDVPFNNFIVSFMSLDGQTYFPEFVSRFGSSIRSLKIRAPGGYEMVAFLLKNCDQLENLELDVLYMPLLAGIDKEELFDGILHSLRNLRRLHIYTLRERTVPVKATIEVFLKILRSCTKLREFNFPSIGTYNDKLSYEHKKQEHQEAVNQRQEQLQDPNIDPLQRRMLLGPVPGPGGVEDWERDVLERAVDPIPGWNPKYNRDIFIQPVIDFIRASAKNKHLFIKRIDISELDYFTSSFVDLVKTCHENGIKITNIHSTQVLTLQNPFLFHTPDYCNVFESAKVSKIHRWFPLVYMDNLESLHLILHPSKSAEDEKLSEEDELVLPQLASLRVQFMFGINLRRDQLLLKKLFNERERPTVRKLHLERFIIESDRTASQETIWVKGVTDNFRNLTELILDGSKASQEDFNTLWINLLELQKITIKECRNLTNEAFVGDYDLRDESNIQLRPFNRLKKLHTLIIKDSFGNVTDIALLESFRWIGLRHFEFVTNRTIQIQWELYLCLAQSPLGKSVEYFVAPEPLPHRYYNERIVMRKFRNLKRKRFL